MKSSFKKLASQPFKLKETEIGNLLSEFTNEPLQLDKFSELMGFEDDALVLTVENGIATIPVKGIMMGRNVPTWEKQIYNFIDVNDVEILLKDAINSTEVKAIVLDIDSPGGSVQGINEIYDMIIKARTAKPVIASTNGYCCSASYEIASACSAIYATKSAYVGAIGTYIILTDSSEYYKKFGLKNILIKAGEFKGLGAEGLEITQEQIQALQAEVNYLNDIFKANVRKGRERDIDDSVMQGLAYYGELAKNNGLVDEIVSDYDEVISEVSYLIK